MYFSFEETRKTTQEKKQPPAESGNCFFLGSLSGSRFLIRNSPG